MSINMPKQRAQHNNGCPSSLLNESGDEQIGQRLVVSRSSSTYLATVGGSS
jgi:hypothetical protein